MTTFAVKAVHTEYSKQGVNEEKFKTFSESYIKY